MRGTWPTVKIQFIGHFPSHISVPSYLYLNQIQEGFGPLEALLPVGQLNLRRKPSRWFIFKRILANFVTFFFYIFKPWSNCIISFYELNSFLGMKMRNSKKRKGALIYLCNFHPWSRRRRTARSFSFLSSCTQRGSIFHLSASSRHAHAHKFSSF